MSVKILADKACDLPDELLAKYDITTMPTTVIVGDKDYLDGVDITPRKLFEMIDGNKINYNTVAINTDTYVQMFEKYRHDYDSVVHINLSTGFSACHQNARIAAEDMDNVFVVDSLNLSSGIGHLVLDAAEMAGQGVPGGEIAERLNAAAPLVEASFVINTLAYLHRGGRCSSLQLLGANLLNFKPCIEVVDGKMHVGKKYRGSFDSVILKYVEDRLSNREDIDTSRVFITYSPMDNMDIVDAVEKKIAEFVRFDTVIRSDASCTISCHCGPNTLGILFKKKA